MPQLFIVEKKVWIITDKNRKIAAYGTPRNRYLRMIDSGTKSRLMTYPSKKVAENGYTLSWFYDGEDVDAYIISTYGEKWKPRHGGYLFVQDYRDEYMEAVEVVMSIAEVPLTNIA